VLDREGESIGRISSCVWSPRLKKNIALGIVKVGHDGIGSRLEIDSGEQMLRATVVETPFYDPRKENVKGS
jgi:glycine cleavage system aminomethyltransferase T